MSSTYNLEPPPTAKVILRTSQGDLVLELFAKQIPLASRNFLQHCLDGYYDNTIFHRLVPGFILQGGDPTGVGTGGVAAVNNGQPFVDEFHSRLRFNRRGLLGMANSGEPNDNTSQFFLTLDNTPELQGKNTMFGRIEGDTIYNLMKMSEAELADANGDRPLYPTRVLGAEILVNPFEDMVKSARASSTRDGKGKGDDGKKKRKVTKTLLSFDDEDENEPVQVSKKHKVNPSFRPADKSIEKPKPKPKPAPSPAVISQRIPSRSPSPVSAPAHAPTVQQRPMNPSPPAIEESPIVASTMTALERTNAQIAALKQSMKRNAPTTDQAAAEKPRKKSALEAMIPEGATRGRKRGAARGGSGDSEALESFNAFRRKLDSMAGSKLEGHRSARITEPAAHEADDARREEEEEEDMTRRADEDGHLRSQVGNTDGDDGHGDDADVDAKICDLHFIADCQSCTAWDKEQGDTVDVDVDEDDTSLLAHSLSFAKDLLGKDLEWKRKMDGLVEFDPRAPNAGTAGQAGSDERDRRKIK